MSRIIRSSSSAAAATRSQAGRFPMMLRALSRLSPTGKSRFTMSRELGHGFLKRR